MLNRIDVQNNPVNFIDPWGLATVHVWRPSAHSKYGHVAIESDSGKYLSHHPKKTGFNRLGSKFRSKAEDVALYKGGADFQYKMTLPDEAALDAFIDQYKADEKFWGFFGNCADATTKALNAGGHGAPDLSDGPLDFISYPDEMINYLSGLEED